MNTARYEQIFDAYDACRVLDASSRAALLRELCRGDEELRQEVIELLERADREDALDDRRIDSQSPLSIAPLTPVEETWPAAGLSSHDPQQVGPYRVLDRLGAGGMGIVYEAEQEFPRRRVALKLIRSIEGGAELLARFEREAAALARLHHPGIAQFYDFGTYDSPLGAQPYFALEKIDGVDLRTHASRGALDLQGKLELVARV